MLQRAVRALSTARDLADALVDAAVLCSHLVVGMHGPLAHTGAQDLDTRDIARKSSTFGTLVWVRPAESSCWGHARAIEARGDIAAT